MRPLALVGLLIAGAARAQVPAFFEPPPPGQRRVVEAGRAAQKPDIDGELSDEAWRAAVPTGGFVQREPNQGQPATRKAVVRVLFDDDALYVAAELEQPGGWTVFNQRDLRRDFSLTECDSFSVILDTLGDGRNAFSFSVNPFGAQLDQQVIDDALFEPNWDTLWRAATKRSDAGWTVELAIPWKSLRYGGPKTPWGVQFYRRERGRNEDTVWSPIPRTVTPWRMPYAGIIEGIEPAKASLLALQLRPYLVGRLEQTGEGPFSFAPSGGGEVTWNPTPSASIDLTANTDFAETDVDRRVVNFSRFSVFFPERRQFFLESAGLFASGFLGRLQPFFSRQIGLRDGRAVPVSFGARGVYRSTERSAGALVVHTLPTATSSPTLFAVGRYSHNLGAQSRVGGMFVARHDFEGASGEDTTNLVPVVDALHRVGPLTVSASVMGSSTSTRRVARYGAAGTLDVKLQGNWGYLGANAFGVTPNFEARTGFVARDDLLGVGAGGGVDLRPAWLPTWLRTIGPFVDGYAIWNASTLRFQEAYVYLAPMWLLFRGGDEAWLFVEQYLQELTDPFAPIGGLSFAPGAYAYERIGFSAFSQASRKVSFGVEGAVGTYYSASTVGTQVRASVQPIPHVQLAGTYTYNRFWGPGVAGDFVDTHLVLAETRLALSPRLQLIGSYQRDTDGNASVLNARLAWEFLPLSFVYVVLTDTRSLVAREGAPPSELRVVAKVTYTWRP